MALARHHRNMAISLIVQVCTPSRISRLGQGDAFPNLHCSLQTTKQWEASLWQIAGIVSGFLGWRQLVCFLVHKGQVSTDTPPGSNINPS
jgi:hypothetical protein